MFLFGAAFEPLMLEFIKTSCRFSGGFGSCIYIYTLLRKNGTDRKYKSIIKYYILHIFLYIHVFYVLNYRKNYMGGSFNK